jgi:hypothetical protein
MAIQAKRGSIASMGPCTSFKLWKTCGKTVVSIFALGQNGPEMRQIAINTVF